MHSKLALFAVLLIGLEGCIFYKHKDNSFVADDDPVDTDRPDRPDRDTDVDTDVADTDVDTDTDTDVTDTDVAADAFFFTPDHADAGTTVIVSLFGDGSPSLNSATAVRFYGGAGVQVLAIAHRSAAELLVTLQMGPDNGWTPPQDALIEFSDNSAVFLPGAFTVDTQP